MPLVGKMLVSSYVFFIPFYFWRSGIPQVSDLILALLILWTVTTTLLRGKQNEDGLAKSQINKVPFFWFALFVYYTVLVNFTWALISPEKAAFVRSAVYLVFSFATMATFVALYTRYRNQLGRVLYFSLTASLVIQLVATVSLMGTQGPRTSAFFNNPNQLGYYALLTAALLTILRVLDSYPAGVHYLSLFACLFISAASLSRGALVATLVVLVCALVFEPRGRGVRFNMQVKGILFAVSLFVSVGYLLRSQLEGLFNSWNLRAESKGRSGEGLDDRGYQRILENPQHWFLGAGEGGYERFRESIEIHSLLGNIFFSYGIIGALFFTFAIVAIVRRNPYSAIAYGGVFVYGLSHNGIRESLLWVMFAISGVVAIEAVNRQAIDPSASRQTISE